MKKLIAFLASIALVLTATPASAVDDWIPVEPPNPPGFNYETDSMGRNGVTHFLIDEPGVQNQSLAYYRTDSGTYLDCETATSALDCGTGKKGEIQGNAMLPVCGAVIESCIEKVWVYKQGEPEAEATYKRTAEGWYFKGNPAKGIPTGSQTSIWESPLQHSGGNGEYAVRGELSFHASSSKGISVDGLNLRIAPINEIPDDQSRIGKPFICSPPQGGPKQPCGSTVGNDSAGNCIYMQDKVCGRAQVPADGTRFGLQLILHNEVTGWFRGRVSDPTISVKKVNAMYNRVTIHANPVNIPKLLVSLNTKEGDPDLRKLFPNSLYGKQNYGGSESANPTTIKLIDAVRKKAKDTASGISNLWAFSTVNANAAANGASRCLQDDSRLVGVVTTNAMAYVGTAPKWSNGFLSYDVAGMHNLPDGSLALGSYDLVMRSDVARCLYGFSKAPLSATVSVVNEKGTKTTATTVVSEKNGWLKMAAYGFTFSKKTIKVKITKKKK